MAVAVRVQDAKGERVTTMKDDLISRQAAIDAVDDWWITVDDNRHPVSVIKALPSAQPERLTDDDFETIRIHLNAYKEKLCNQRRWEEAEEYQRIIDRFMAFASAQPEITDCDYCHEDFDGYVRPIEKNSHAWLVRRGRTMKLHVCFKGEYRECDILFCPMCGRRLGGQNR